MQAKLRVARAALTFVGGVALGVAGPALGFELCMAEPMLVADNGAPLVPSAPAVATPAAPAAAPAAGNPQPYALGDQQVRYGNAIVFRSLIPSPLLEQLTDNEYRQTVQDAAQRKRLLPPNNARVKRLRTIVMRLAPYAVKWSERVKGWNWEIEVLRSRSIRAFCLPGGKVLVDSGLLERLRLTDDELGVLFAHEIAHALREHARSSLGEQQAASLGTGATPLPPLFGLSEPLPAPLGVVERFASVRYDPTDETEADVIGGDIAARAGFDPRAAITLWDKLAVATRADKDNGFIHAHPYDTRRRNDLRKRLADLMPLYRKALVKNADARANAAGANAAAGAKQRGAAAANR
ncbi:M48 family metallopeptidase [Burkholderia pseudomallei]|uniref:M48 family metallopeptidase n=1 Tax=Burkholderia pseudomallei TaxID=28450 RepID=UPI0005F28CD2|nr:M48 family metallopeptidase [Burkholderia pseudomallei]KJR95771.1 peptidase M48 [Burkholderia pseudomallei]MDA5592570.1 M48 family metallopeptidase [Burkholderia pseudomallei]OND67057.1 peptidase M48 [Burkholderia pseudomallei]OND68933.1 peptidase M48 [Burkholderia pseudomallei]OND83904.1 peptidase M48 [Burkholderia pseudomallei]